MGRHWRKLKRHYLMHWQFVKVVKTELQFRSICPTNSDKRLHSHIVFRRRQVYPFLLFVHFVRLTYLNSSSLKCPKKIITLFFLSFLPAILFPLKNPLLLFFQSLFSQFFICSVTITLSKAVIVSVGCFVFFPNNCSCTCIYSLLFQFPIIKECGFIRSIDIVFLSC